MKTRSIASFALVFLAAGTLLCATGMSAENRGRETMTLDGGALGSVKLEHHLHQDMVRDCQACHRDFKQEEGALDAAKAAGTLKKKQVMNQTCIACHRAKKKAGERTGPVSCKDCHKK